MKKRIKSILLFCLFLVVFAALSQLLSGTGITPDFNEDALTVSGPKKFSFTVDYDRIAQLELVELTDPGNLVSGDETRTYFWGSWENDTWGEYTLCVTKKADTAILITMQDGEYLVFNYMDNDTTASVFQMFTELLAHRGEEGA